MLILKTLLTQVHFISRFIIEKIMHYIIKTIISFSVLLFFTPYVLSKTITISAFSTPALSSDQFYKIMAKNIEHKTNKDIKVKLLVRGELGSDESHFYALRRGRVQIAGVGLQSIATLIPEISILNAPYLFESWQELDFIYNKKIIPFINKLLSTKGVIGIRFYGSSWHGIYSKKPIYEPKDAKGRRFRILIDPASHLFVKALEADMFQIAQTDAVTALQTGLIDTGETNTHVYNITGTSHAAPFFTRTRHTPSVISIVANKKWYNNLNPIIKNIILEAHPSNIISGNALREDEERMLKAASKTHVTVIEPNNKFIKKWKKIGLNTHEELINNTGGKARDLYNLVFEGKKQYKEKIK